jgi:hypothetical protein
MLENSVSEFVQKEFEAFRKAFARPLVKRSVLVLTGVLFVAGTYLSLKAAPGLMGRVSWPYVILLFAVGAPLQVIAHSLDIAAMAKAVGSRIAFFDCLRASIVSTASNILPGPGGSLVRIAALSSSGASVSSAAWITLISGVIWAAIAFAAAGFVLLRYNANVASAFAAVAIAMSVGVGVLAVRLELKPVQLFAIAAVKAVVVAIESLRYYWALMALGVAPNIFQAIVLSVSTVAGSVVAIAPSGLGIREMSAALLAEVVALDPGAGFLSSALNRVTAYAMLAILAVGFGFLKQEKLRSQH